MHKLFIDFETRSPLDLKKAGLDNYSKHPETKVLMMAWAFDESAPQLWFPEETKLPDHILLMLTRKEILKVAFNVEFERTIAREVLGIDIPINHWVDPGVMARYASIAGSLGFVGEVLGLPEDEAKSAAGAKLIKVFCSPNKKGEFNDKTTHPEEWAQFGEYCRQDVVAERKILEKLKAFQLPSLEEKIWFLDQTINDRGIPVDLEFVAGGKNIVAEERNRLMTELTALTNLENANSRIQMLRWLQGHGYEFKSLGKKWVDQTLNDTTSPLSEDGRRGLELRKQLAKSSTAKLEALANFVGPDGVLRRQYVYGGAARTMRWSGRAVQLQNLPRGSVKDVEGAVATIKAGDCEAARKFGPPLEVVSSCLRSAFRAPAGKHFVVSDLSAIENRVLGWIADCPAILNVFKNGLDPYVDFGTRLFNLPYEELDPKVSGLTEAEKKFRGEKRQISKPAVLGCGYSLSGGKYDIDRNGDEIKTGLFGYAAQMGIEITEDDAAKMVRVFRSSYPEVPKFWRRIERAAIEAIRTGENQTVEMLTVGCVKPCKLMFIVLPSGRRLHYIRPDLNDVERWDGSLWTKISYEGNTENTNWGTIPTHSGKITENIDQAISRDVLANGMLRATEAGFTIVGHTHDEVICMEDIGSPLNLTRLNACLSEPPMWAPDLPLAADGFMDVIYRKA